MRAKHETGAELRLKIDFVVLQKMMRKEGRMLYARTELVLRQLWLIMPIRDVAGYHGVYNRRPRLCDKQTTLEISEFPILSQGCDWKIATIRLIPSYILASLHFILLYTTRYCYQSFIGTLAPTPTSLSASSNFEFRPSRDLNTSTSTSHLHHHPTPQCLSPKPS